MTKKTLGYVHLVWTCPRCQTRNPGPQKFCNGCGGPQPKDVRFEQPSEEKLITDQEEIARAKAGPDIHCPYCEARNPGNAKFCGACGGDLQAGQVRESGRVLGAHRAGPAQPVTCSACGWSNSADAQRCQKCGASLAAPVSEAPSPVAQPTPAAGARRLSPLVIVGGVVVLIAAAVCLLVFAGRTESVQGEVRGVQWSRTIPIEALLPMEQEGWYDEVPSEATDVSCRLAYRYTQDQPAPNATEVCGTPYTEDTGSGYGEVVQDCVYEVYEDLCTYTVLGWKMVDEVTASGSNLNPYWPQVGPVSDQRQGEGEESFEVVLQTKDGTYNYRPSDATEFAAFQPGSRWELEINALGSVVSVKPVR